MVEVLSRLWAEDRGQDHRGVRCDVGRDPRDRGGNYSADRLKRQQRFLQRVELLIPVFDWPRLTPGRRKVFASAGA